MDQIVSIIVLLALSSIPLFVWLGVLVVAILAVTKTTLTTHWSSWVKVGIVGLMGLIAFGEIFSAIGLPNPPQQHQASQQQKEYDDSGSRAGL